MRGFRAGAAAVGVVLASVLAGCTSATPAGSVILEQPGEDGPSADSLAPVVEAIGGDEYGTVTAIRQQLGDTFLNSGQVCEGMAVDLTSAADTATLERVLGALAVMELCTNYQTEIRFDGHPTVIRGDEGFFRRPPEDVSNLTEAVYSAWPASVWLRTDPNTIYFQTEVPGTTDPIDALEAMADALSEGLSQPVAAPTDEQAPVRVRIAMIEGAAEGDDIDGPLLNKRERSLIEADLDQVLVVGDGSGTAPAAELVREIVERFADSEGKKHPGVLRLQFTGETVRGSVLLPAPPVETEGDRTGLAGLGPSPLRVSPWGTMPDYLHEDYTVPEGEDWLVALAEATPAAEELAADVHELVATYGFQDEVEVVLADLSDPIGALPVGRFDTPAG